MLELFDPQALRLHADARRASLLDSMRAARRTAVGYRLGLWLVSVGERLSREDALRPAADCG